ncbi:MAG: tRNA pseudouridine(38-40) synthase TruA [Euryarchaeota archaeon]|nr:tRNA pseudouridine(38-40) synthase TruA [Euryarchaeota archaeon]
MRNVALKVAYIGTNYYGFQRQPNLKTVEGELIDALKKSNLIDNFKNAGYSIAGRTDRGVHALGNVVSFRTDKDVIINQINDFLPEDIRILGKANVHFGFKPRFAQSRHYKYIIVDSGNLNLKLMVEASKKFCGTHNFQNFSKRSERNPIRTIDTINIQKDAEKEDIITIDVVGESFLWNMVRKIVKVLFKIGNGESGIDEIDKFFDLTSKVVIKPMPPECLILMDVEYKRVEFEFDEYAKRKFLSRLKEEYLSNKTISSVERVMMDKLKLLGVDLKKI